MSVLLITIGRFREGGDEALQGAAYRAHVGFRNDAFEDVRSHIADDLVPSTSDGHCG